MSKILIIAEKPSVGKAIAKELPGTFYEEEGYLEGQDHIITWALGHLLRLAAPEHYKPAWKRWRRDHLPLLPEKFDVEPGAGRAKDQLRVVRKLWNMPEVNEIWNACDAGREGELIFAWIRESMSQKAQKKPVRRMWLSSLTPQAIKDALKDAKPAADYQLLEQAARSRAEADWIVGLSATRAATIQFRSAWDGVASLGRVQTPTLAILAKREQEIKDFKPEKYWLVQAEMSAAGGDFPARYSEERLDQALAQEVVEQTRGQKGTLSKLDKKEVKEAPPMLFDLTTLQRSAGSEWGWTAKRTLQVAQSLYDKHGALTYPRTDSRYLTEDMESTLMQRAAVLPSSLQGFVQGLPAKLPDRVFKNSAVRDHHAILPTEKALPKGVNEDEEKLYLLVAKRFLASLYPEAKAERTSLEVTITGKNGQDYKFRGKGKSYKQEGWRAIEGFETSPLPLLQKDEEIVGKSIKAVEKETKPPRRFSDASLLGAMETAGKEIDDEAAREAMKEGGLGTPATRASIIERLIQVEYLERQGRSLQVTEKGMKLIEALGPNQLTKPELTGKWEERLLQMEQGKEERQKFMDSIADFAGKLIEEIVSTEPPKPTDRHWGDCPNCSRPLYENRKAVSCWTSDDPGCGRSVWKKVLGKTLPEAQLRELVEQGATTEQVQGLRSKKNRSFKAKLKVIEKDGKWITVLNEEWVEEAAKKKAEEKAESAKKAAEAK